MLDLSEHTFGTFTDEGFYVTLASAAEIQIKRKDKPLGFKFQKVIHL